MCECLLALKIVLLKGDEWADVSGDFNRTKKKTYNQIIRRQNYKLGWRMR